MIASAESVRRCTNGQWSTAPLNTAGLPAGRISLSNRRRSTLGHWGMSVGIYRSCLVLSDNRDLPLGSSRTTLNIPSRTTGSAMCCGRTLRFSCPIRNLSYGRTYG